MRLLTVGGKVVSVGRKAIEIPDSSGGAYQIAVETSAGATVTATKGATTVSATADTGGNCTLTVYEPGQWTITVVKGDSSISKEIEVGTQSLQISFAPDAVFSNNTWGQVISACQSGQVPSTWSVGDSLPMLIGGTNYQVDIIGKSHDDYADGSGKAPLTFQLHDCYDTGYGMNDTETVVGGWQSSKMRTEYLPSILALMPKSVKNGIREVSKKNAATASSIVTSADKLFLLSEIEVFGSRVVSAAGEGTKYSYYTNANRVKTKNGTATIWWERSLNFAGAGGFGFVGSSGSANGGEITGLYGVSFAFCF